MNGLTNSFVDQQPLVDVSPNGPVAPLRRSKRAKGCLKLNYISPQASAGVQSFATQGLTIFKLSDSEIDLVDKWILQFTIQNNDANPITLTSSHYFIQRLEVLVNGSTVEQINNFSLWSNELVHTDVSTAATRAASLNYAYNPTTGIVTNAPSLASGASGTYYLDFNTVLDRSGLNFKFAKLSNDIELRVYFNSVPGIIYGNVLPTVNPTLSQVSLYCLGRELDSTERARQYDKIKAKGFNALSTVRQNLTIPMQTLSANSQYTFIMSGIAGRMVSISAFGAPSSPPQGSSMMTAFLNYSTITLLDSSGVPYDITGISESLVQLLFPYLFQGAFLTLGQQLWYRSLAPDPVSSELTQDSSAWNPSLRGGCVINNNRIQFQTPASVPVSAQSLYITFLQHAAVMMNSNGRVSVETL
jgi:hypothetical protein